MRETYGLTIRKSCRLAMVRRSTWYYKSRRGIRVPSVNGFASSRLQDHALATSESMSCYDERAGRSTGSGSTGCIGSRDCKCVREFAGGSAKAFTEVPCPRPTTVNVHWSMDFVHDQLVDGRAFRVLRVIDQWSRDSVLVEAGHSLCGQDVAEALTRVSWTRSLPKAITVDHGTEFTSLALDQWAWERGVEPNVGRDRGGRAVFCRFCPTGQYIRIKCPVKANCQGPTSARVVNPCVSGGMTVFCTMGKVPLTGMRNAHTTAP
jgi:putative transposase